jgi:bis(5'-nucleosyl)-tetraphosphatase (symmetrical)
MALGDAVTTVLGNHDFHLLTVAAGHRKPHRSDTLDAILAAPDREAILAWLTARPLVVAEGDLAMVHAGFLPSWTLAQALSLSNEVQAVLASDRAHEFLGVLYGDEPRRWSDDLPGYDRLRAAVNACTRLRFCTVDDTMELTEKRGPEHVPAGFLPWFAHPERRSGQATIV